MNVLSGKVALVTGGSKGIGRATSLALARLGATVAINYASDPSSADSLVKEIGSKNARGFQADAGSVNGTKQLIEDVVKHFGRLDCVIANAGKHASTI